MKKYTVIILSILMAILSINSQTYSIEKNYKWVQIPLYGGVVNSISHGNTFDAYCTTSGNGLYAMNTGSIWQHIGEKELPDYLYDVVEVGNTILCASDSFIYKSTDTKNWEQVSEKLSKEEIKVHKFELARTKQNEYVIFALTNKGLYKSYDEGNNWQKDPLISIGINALAINENDSARIVIATKNSKLYKTSDFGNTWTEIQHESNYGEIISLILDPNNEKKIIAGTSERGVYISSNYGITWDSTSTGLENLYISFFEYVDNDLYAGTYGGLYKLQAENVIWERVGKGLINPNLMDGIFLEKEKKWYVGTNGDGVRTLDRNYNIWGRYNAQIANLHVRAFSQDKKGETILCGTWGGGIYRSFDIGKSWVYSSTGLTNPYILSLERIGENEFLAGTFNGGLFRSIDGGISWKLMDMSSIFSKYIYSITQSQVEPNIIYIGTNGDIYKTTNRGKYWTKLSLGSWDSPIGKVTDITINPNNKDEIIVGTSETGMYISKNAGREWYSAGKGIDNKYITSIQYHPYQSNFIICTTYGSGVYVSTDNANSWIAMNTGLGNSIVFDVSIQDKKDKSIVVSTDAGIYYMDKYEKGNEWKNFGNDALNFSTRKILWNPSEKIYFAGTDQKGIVKNVQFPNVPVPMQPKKDERITSARPTLRWSETTGVTIPYTFAVVILNQNNEEVYSRNNISGDQFIVPASVLKRYSKYLWKVRAESYAGNTEWSKMYSFTIITKLKLKINETLMNVNGKIIEVDPGRKTTPIIKNGRTFLPIRTVIESFDGTIGWNNEKHTIEIKFQENTIEMEIGNPKSTVNGIIKYIDAKDTKLAPFIVNGRTMIPLRFVAENLNMNIEWDQNEKEIILEYPNK